MGLHAPRGKFERLDVVLASAIRMGTEQMIGCTCRNISARGCRLQIEDARLLPFGDMEAVVQFSIQMEPAGPPIEGSGKVVWLKKERGDMGKVRLILGVEFTAVSLPDRERVKGYIKSKVQP